jgi:hypothetical protein
MPYKKMPRIRQDLLHLPNRSPIRVGSRDWFAWLQQISAFCYQLPHTADRFTLRKEKRRQRFYWYAYIKRDRKLHNAYVGKTEMMTAARLQQVCGTLQVKVRSSRPGTGDG